MSEHNITPDNPITHIPLSLIGQNELNKKDQVVKNPNQNGVDLHVEDFHADDLKENYQTGYIKLFRSICKHWIWKDERKLKWWLTILMECNHKSEKFNLGYTIYRSFQDKNTTALEPGVICLIVAPKRSRTFLLCWRRIR